MDGLSVDPRVPRPNGPYMAWFNDDGCQGPGRTSSRRAAQPVGSARNWSGECGDEMGARSSDWHSRPCVGARGIRTRRLPARELDLRSGAATGNEAGRTQPALAVVDGGPWRSCAVCGASAYASRSAASASPRRGNTQSALGPAKPLVAPIRGLGVGIQFPNGRRGSRRALASRSSIRHGPQPRCAHGYRLLGQSPR